MINGIFPGKVLYAFLVTIVSTLAELPKFHSFDTLEADGKPIGVNNDNNTFASPCFTDWDSDGLTDMIMGCWPLTAATSYNGRIKLYKNIGTTGNPEYTDLGYMKDNTGAELETVGA